MFGRVKMIKVPAPDGKSVISVPKKLLYEPLTLVMDGEQIPEFLKKFQDHARELGLETTIERNTVFRLIGKLHDPDCDFIKELNSCTDMFGRIDWETFLY